MGSGSSPCPHPPPSFSPPTPSGPSSTSHWPTSTSRPSPILSPSSPSAVAFSTAINSNPAQTSTGGPSQTSRPNQPESVSWASWAETDPVHRDGAGSPRAVSSCDLRLAGRHEVSVVHDPVFARQRKGRERVPAGDRPLLRRPPGGPDSGAVPNGHGIGLARIPSAKPALGGGCSLSTFSENGWVHREQAHGRSRPERQRCRSRPFGRLSTLRPVPARVHAAV